MPIKFQSPCHVLFWYALSVCHPHEKDLSSVFDRWGVLYLSVSSRWLIVLSESCVSLLSFCLLMQSIAKRDVEISSSNCRFVHFCKFYQLPHICDALLFSMYKFRVDMSLSLCNVSFYPPVVFLVLKSTLSEINLSTSTFLCLLLA